MLSLFFVKKIYYKNLIKWIKLMIDCRRKTGFTCRILLRYYGYREVYYVLIQSRS